MRRTCLALLLLAGCNDGAQFVTRDQAIDIADDAVDASELSARIEDLEAQVADLERQINGVRRLGLENAGNTANLRETVNHNAQAANNNSARDMTARGGCGYNVIQAGQGVIYQPKPCTAADLSD